jgi:hypothetical protein
MVPSGRAFHQKGGYSGVTYYAWRNNKQIKGSKIEQSKSCHWNLVDKRMVLQFQIHLILENKYIEY